MRNIIPALIVCALLCSIAGGQQVDSVVQPPATTNRIQEFANVVIPLIKWSPTAQMKLGKLGKPGPHLGLAAKLGTGFCLDSACEFVATNYHVAANVKIKKIGGEIIIQRYLATGPHDKEATPNDCSGLTNCAYSTKRDLAIYEMQRPLRRHHGLSFSLDELEVGQEVEVYAYPKGLTIEPIRKLTRTPAKFRGPTTSGLLAFDYEVPGDESIRGGSSGGIVVDKATGKIVGILTGIGVDGGCAIAVSIPTLVEFVTKVQPFLAATIFPSSRQISPVSLDHYPKFVPPHSDGLQPRAEEPDDVKIVRQKAQSLVDSIKDFIAVESYAWGTGEKQPEAEASYEVRVIDGDQLFREYPDGKKESKDPPRPPIDAWIIPVDEWSQLPTMIGTDLRLKIRQAPDVVVNEQHMKVFQYYAAVEDNVCGFLAITDYVFLKTNSTIDLACYGEVWTDEHLNILRISQQLDFQKRFKGWISRVAVLTYGWTELPDHSRRLVPLTTYVEAQNGRHTYWCRGHFTDYQVFSVGARILATKTPDLSLRDVE